MKKWMSTALIIALFTVNNQGMEQVKGFTSLDFAKNEVSDLNEQKADVTPVPTATSEAVGSYYVTYIDGEEEIHVGCYEAGKTATITLDTKEDNDFYRFVGWKDYKGDIHQPGEEVSIYDIPSATFIAVWDGIPHADYYVHYYDELNGNDWSEFNPVVWGRTEYYLSQPTSVDGYVFLGWQHGEKLYPPEAPLTLNEISGNTFTAVWEKIAETTTPSAIPVETVTPTATPVIPPTPSVIPTETITPSKTPIITPEPTPTSTPRLIADYPVTYIDGEKQAQTGWYPAGDVTTITLKSPESKEGYRFVGWKDYKGDIHQPGEEVGVKNIPTATFTAVWEKIVETATPSVAPIITVTPNAISGETSSITPIETPTPTSKPNVNPVIKKAKVKITTNAKKKFLVGKKYIIKANRINTKEKMQWVVSNKKIATINKNTGVLKAKKAGKVTITVICGKVKDRIKIIIKKK